ncbi:hypothetical protein [Culturomica massiliensis]|jgi:hypothetical protein|uniref:hypothetical protein n=1 Tax=Culturomica massiliensis TaxID=1841857 RepID=UPI000E55F582|nr:MULTISPECIES: hypothetical protein [Odoribacteraceae]RHV92949.1 hypothetical protein DXA95_11310 [Odoribacter sp. OF09-27XD]
MENTDKQYDRTIGKIREMQPVLEHPEKLSRQIMEHIATRLPEHAAAGSRLSIIRMLSGMAAAMVIGLFVYELTKPFPVLREAAYADITGQLDRFIDPASPIPEKIKQYAAFRQAQEARKQQREEFYLSSRMSNLKKQSHEK